MVCLRGGDAGGGGQGGHEGHEGVGVCVCVGGGAAMVCTYDQLDPLPKNENKTETITRWGKTGV